MNKKGENITYLIEKMENSQNLQYDPNKTFYENLKEHQDGKKLLELSDNQNFLKHPATEQAVDERDFQSVYWQNLRRSVKQEDVVWLPNMCKLEKLEAGGK